MARTTWFLKCKQWKKIEPILPNTVPGKKGGGLWYNRLVLEGLWVLQSGARWRDLPERSLKTSVMPPCGWQRSSTAVHMRRPRSSRMPLMLFFNPAFRVSMMVTYNLELTCSLQSIFIRKALSDNCAKTVMKPVLDMP